MDTVLELRFSKLLSAVGAYKAAALHLSVGVPPSLRIADQIVTLTEEDLLMEDFMLQLVEALLTEEQLQRLHLLKSLVVCVMIKNKTRCKLHAYYQQGTLSLTLSLISSAVTPVEQLPVSQAVKALTQIKSGLVIVAGGYGQGKSTVLAGIIESLNQTTAQHIVTFEQPVEYIFTDTKAIVEQLELGRDLPDVNAIIPFLEQEDVDTMLLSTVLDASTFKTALHCAQMGKLVLLEVTAPTASLALSECLSMFLSAEQPAIRELLAMNLQAVIALRMTTGSSTTTVITAEVARQTPGLSHLLRTDSVEKLALVIENGHNEGMITFAQSINELQGL